MTFVFSPVHWTIVRRGSPFVLFAECEAPGPWIPRAHDVIASDIVRTLTFNNALASLGLQEAKVETTQVVARSILMVVASPRARREPRRAFFASLRIYRQSLCRSGAALDVTTQVHAV